MYVLDLFSVNVCVYLCVFVCVCDYLLISEPTGANWGRMTMMRCVACALGWFWCGCHFVVFLQLPLRHT